MGKLYLVPTPIGNLDDMTLWAIEVLKNVNTIACEDTRYTRVLLNHFEIKARLVAYHEHNEEVMTPKLVTLLASEDVAVVTDAGTPGISDPGYRLVKASLEAGVNIEALPGATAFVPALVASGLATDKFMYLGFLPKKEGARKLVLQKFANLGVTTVVYESPYRTVDLLGQISDWLGDRIVVVARELSKRHETFYRGDVLSVKKQLEEEGVAGEVVVLIDGQSPTLSVSDDSELILLLKHKMNDGVPVSRAVKEVALEQSVKKSRVYDLAIQLSRSVDEN